MVNHKSEEAAEYAYKYKTLQSNHLFFHCLCYPFLHVVSIYYRNSKTLCVYIFFKITVYFLRYIQSPLLPAIK